ncbi:MAG TPA: endopeptidase La [Clostridiales bacterium UBA8153]|nr:endopeptidase La [Clostridiales bacterium UBA8153]
MATRARRTEYPLLPLRGVFVFPTTIVPLEVGRSISVSAVEEAVAGNGLLMLATQRELTKDNPGPEDIHDFGTLAQIKQITRMSAGNIRVIVEGRTRARITKHLDVGTHLRVLVEEIPEPTEPLQEKDALMRALVQQYEEYIRASKKVPPEALVSIATSDEPGKLADSIALHVAARLEDKQKVLEAVSIRERLERVMDILGREMELLELEKRLNARVRKQIEKTQKEYYLREQMKAIQKELGERDDKAAEGEELRAKVAAAGLPQEIAERVLREVERLEKMPPMAAEAVVVRNYLEWIVSLPWNVQTQDCMDLFRAERILDEDHYGLDKAKERITEYLAVRQLVQKIRGPILCLVGPPGVGKTSLGKSVARALDRKFVRISLGGVRDEAEVRGHRRTYVGALPGRIIQGMRTAGSKNPVFLMDEIDKLSSDFRGDPASALLEVLDPEQNSTFSDHYLEVPFDLSSVMFITTANSVYGIPRPLLDRMEVIQIPGYTEEEKLGIGMQFLVPKQLREHGLKPGQLQFTRDGIAHIIRYYTREAGVRNLERELAGICRKTARDIVKGQRKRVRVTAKRAGEILGVPRYRHAQTESQSSVGIVMGIAVTDTGGDVMPVEVAITKGKGSLLLTGKLGEVMRESAQAGISYIRSRASALGLAEDFYEKLDIHIHVPEGAIPKDGPSAGITMATAVVSALCGLKGRHEVAMTGEITLRGRVLPVGGIKEKVLAAHRAGIATVIIPEDNRRDIEEIPAEVRAQVNIVLVEHMDRVLMVALEPGPDPQPGPEDLPLAEVPAGHGLVAQVTPAART